MISNSKHNNCGPGRVPLFFLFCFGRSLATQVEPTGKKPSLIKRQHKGSASCLWTGAFLLLFKSTSARCVCQCNRVDEGRFHFVCCLQSSGSVVDLSPNCVAVNRSGFIVLFKKRTRARLACAQSTIELQRGVPIKWKVTCLQRRKSVQALPLINNTWSLSCGSKLLSRPDSSTHSPLWHLSWSCTSESWSVAVGCGVKAV